MLGGMALHRFERLTREEIAAVAPRAIFVLPVAATEQHGPHLAATTDTALVTAVAERACARVADDVEVLLAPTLCYGASDHHLAFGGTLSLSSETLRAVLSDLVRSAIAAGCIRLLLLNGHGGNAATCNAVAADVARLGRVTIANCSYWDLVEPPEGVLAFAGHAGQFETSLMLAVCPELVHLDRARPSPGTSVMPPRGLALRPPDAWQRIDGFTDDPTGASRELGEAWLERCVAALGAALLAIAAA
jgi:creatinine amidohydrolase